MSTKTKNINLEKPGQDDFYDIGIFNNNADIIDREIGKTNKVLHSVYKAKAIKEFGTLYTSYEILDDRLPNNVGELYEGMQIDVYFAKRDNVSTQFHSNLSLAIKINNMPKSSIMAGGGTLAFEDIEGGSIQTLKYYNGQWFLMSPPITKWESFLYKLEMAPSTNLSSVQITSAIYRDGFISLVFRCYVSKALTAGTVMKAKINIEDFAIASLCSGGGYLGRATIVGTLGTSGEFNINFSGADFGATANFLFAINIPVNTKKMESF